jgi:hypothetical protein
MDYIAQKIKPMEELEKLFKERTRLHDRGTGLINSISVFKKDIAAAEEILQTIPSSLIEIEARIRELAGKL